jgi:hypothetical protein
MGFTQRRLLHSFKEALFVTRTVELSPSLLSRLFSSSVSSGMADEADNPDYPPRLSGRMTSLVAFTSSGASELLSASAWSRPGSFAMAAIAAAYCDADEAAGGAAR